MELILKFMSTTQPDNSASEKRIFTGSSTLPLGRATTLALMVAMNSMSLVAADGKASSGAPKGWLKWQMTELALKEFEKKLPGNQVLANHIASLEWGLTVAEETKMRIDMEGAAKNFNYSTPARAVLAALDGKWPAITETREQEKIRKEIEAKYAALQASFKSINEWFFTGNWYSTGSKWGVCEIKKGRGKPLQVTYKEPVKNSKEVTPASVAQVQITLVPGQTYKITTDISWSGVFQIKLTDDKWTITLGKPLKKGKNFINVPEGFGTTAYLEIVNTATMKDTTVSAFTIGELEPEDLELLTAQTQEDKK